jgi:hypothetical protein
MVRWCVVLVWCVWLAGEHRVMVQARWLVRGRALSALADYDAPPRAYVYRAYAHRQVPPEAMSVQLTTFGHDYGKKQPYFPLPLYTEGEAPP